MQLSRERESELVEKNMPKIYRAVDNFMAKNTGGNVCRITYDDCVQEVSVVLLNYIRKCETEEQLNMFPWYDAIHAMSNLVLCSQPLAFPKRTTDFNRVIHSVPHTVSFDVLASSGVEIDGMSKHWVPDTDTKLDFDMFMSTQNENVQRIASMRLYGMSQRDIARQCGVCKRAIDKKLSSLYEDYNDFFKEEDEDE